MTDSSFFIVCETCIKKPQIYVYTDVTNDIIIIKKLLIIKEFYLKIFKNILSDSIDIIKTFLKDKKNYKIRHPYRHRTVYQKNYYWKNPMMTH